MRGVFMGIWKKALNIEDINKFSSNTLVSHLGIKITNSGEDYLEGTMPVDERTVQPFRLLHGGASCVLAETLGSIAASFCIESPDLMAVGQHIEATHLRPATKGIVRGKAKAIYIGKTSQTWKIEIFNDEDKLICDSKIIMAVIKKKI
jgi:1,4-dihydroxy-2-naphthoyl-CoA hydrolase